MLRIAAAAPTCGQVLLTLDGQVSRETVELLAEEVQRCLGLGGKVVLDLEGLTYLDQAGLALLEGWTRERLELRGGSLYIRTQLESRGLSSAGRRT